MVTSRPEQDIEDSFGTLHPDLIDEGKEASNKDIMKYLELLMELKFKGTMKILEIKYNRSWRSARRDHTFTYDLFDCS